MSWWGNLRKTHSFIWWTCDMDQEYKSLRENWASRKNWTYAFCNPWTRINVHSFSRFLPNTAIVLLSMGRSVFWVHLVDLDFGVGPKCQSGKRGWECHAEWYYIHLYTWILGNSKIWTRMAKWVYRQGDKVWVRWERFCILESFCILGILLYVRKVFWGFWRNVWAVQWENHYILECKKVNVLDSVSVVGIPSFFWQTWSCRVQWSWRIVGLSDWFDDFCRSSISWNRSVFEEAFCLGLNFLCKGSPLPE